jgi:hypothetical protein
MDDLVIADLRRQLQTKSRDMWPVDRRLTPADPMRIAKDEVRLGFVFPPLLKQIYLQVGNGGFGPGYGLIGLTNGIPNDLGKTVPELYELFRSSDPNDPTWQWPRGLLPICDWGCAILSCIDCADSNFRMRIFDPNVHEGDDWTDSFFEEAAAFEIWIKEWTSGTNLWDKMYGEDGHIRRILTARHPDRA